MARFISFSAARLLLDMSSVELIKLLNSGEIVGRYTYPHWRISATDVEVYAHDQIYEIEQRERELHQRNRVRRFAEV